MDPGGSGFRLLEMCDTGSSRDRKVVIYRLDPATLDFAEISGQPEQLLGFPVDEWYRPRFWSGRVHPGDREAMGAFFDGWTKARRDEQLEYRVIDAAGRTVWVHQVIAVGRDERQDAAIVRGVLMDVTERIARDADVEQARLLKAELFRIVTEELAPPVRAIAAYSEMLQRHLAAQRDDVGSDLAVGLRDGLQRLDTRLVQLMRIAQDGISIDEMNAGLAAIRDSGRAG